jgi:AcrR family transcriptional regulator
MRHTSPTDFESLPAARPLNEPGERMVRTKADDFGDKQQLILDTAADVFATKGFNVATTTDVAVACGMSKSALYRYHRSKEAILYSLLLSHLTQVIQRVQEAIRARSEPLERFCAFLTSLLESNAVCRSKNIVLLNETTSLAREERGEFKRLEKKLVEIGTELLHALNPALMAHSDLRMPYTMFLFGLVNWTYTWYDNKRAMTPAEIAVRIADLFLHGFTNISAAGYQSDGPMLCDGRFGLPEL